MIITKQLARDMNKTTLATLASDYATEFAHLLGHVGDVRIEPEELVYEKKEALNLFLKKFQPKSFSRPMKKSAKVRYNYEKEQINQKIARVQDGIAFIPLSDLSRREIELVEKIKPNQPKKHDLCSKLVGLLFGINADYASLNGFGSEIAHLTGHRIYPTGAPNGLGEALDIFSTILELRKNVKFLYGQKDKEDDSEAIIAEELKRDIAENRKEVVLYEALLFQGDEAAKQKIVELGLFKSRDLDFVLHLLKREYLMSNHYDGSKLFVEIIDSVNGDLNQAYRKLGRILTNPLVTDMDCALTEIGYTPEALSKYRGVFGKNISERIKQLSP